MKRYSRFGVVMMALAIACLATAQPPRKNVGFEKISLGHPLTAESPMEDGVNAAWAEPVAAPAPVLSNVELNSALPYLGPDSREAQITSEVPVANLGGIDSGITLASVEGLHVVAMNGDTEKLFLLPENSGGLFIVDLSSGESMRDAGGLDAAGSIGQGPVYVFTDSSGPVISNSDNPLSSVFVSGGARP